MGVQTLRAEAPVEGFDERIVCWFARPAEVQSDTIAVGPQIKVAGDELSPLIDTDRLRIANDRAGSFQCGDDILCSIIETRVKYWRIAREQVDDSQDTDLVASGQLVVNKVQ